MGRYGNLNYESLAKFGTLASVALVLAGGVGAAVGSGTLPDWEVALLFDLEIVGVLGLLFCPFVFGVLFPLTE
jgi:hypothetical protein